MTEAVNISFAPNSEDESGSYWDPWDAMHIHNGGYSSNVENDAIEILRAIRDGVKDGRDGGQYGNYVTDIANKTGLSEGHVELWQYIFCSAGWCNYGTSPRGCFPDQSIDFDALIEAWAGYYRRKWEQEPGA